MTSEIDRRAVDGSQIFMDLSNFTGISIDKVNFLMVYIASFPLAGFLRTSLSTKSVTPETRHAFCIFFGVFFSYFCFGKNSLHFTGLSTIMYAVINTQEPKFLHIKVFVISMFYLSCVHLYFQFIINDETSLDICGPLMLMVAKVSSLACSLHDGLSRREEDLTPLQKKRLLRKIPTVLEYYSYMFQFLTVLAGPLTFYDEYLDFIYERKMQEAQKKMSDKELNSAITFIAWKKVICGYLTIIAAFPFMYSYEVKTLIDDDFLENRTIFYQLWYINALMSVARLHYYYAWLCAEGICNNAGFGLNGFDENGKIRMDLLTNINVWKIETASNIHEYSKYWNTVTIRWLRFVIYERAPRFRRVATYITSTVWHGFNPRYSVPACHGLVYVFTAFSFRRHVRPFFLESKILKFLYDLVSIVATRIGILIMAALFGVMELESPFKFFRKLYFLHLFLTIAAAIIPPLILPVKKGPSPSNAKENKSESNKNKVA